MLLPRYACVVVLRRLARVQAQLAAWRSLASHRISMRHPSLEQEGRREIKER